MSRIPTGSCDTQSSAFPKPWRKSTVEEVLFQDCRKKTSHDSIREQAYIFVQGISWATLAMASTLTNNDGVQRLAHCRGVQTVAMLDGA